VSRQAGTAGDVEGGYTAASVRAVHTVSGIEADVPLIGKIYFDDAFNFFLELFDETPGRNPR